MEDSTNRRLAIGLGCFSIGLGLAELLAPRAMARAIGVPAGDDMERTLRTFGAREIGTGVAILAQPDQARWLWARVGGDALDLTALARAAAADDARGGRLAIAVASVLGAMALDVYAAKRLTSPDGSRSASTTRRGIEADCSVTINKPIEEVFAFWANLENLPRFMSHLESVTRTAADRSHWRIKAPGGVPIEWDAETVEERENELISWRSTGSVVENSGTVRFERAPGARGTEVHVGLRYRLPAGRVSRALLRAFSQAPEQHVKEELRRFKQILETGEVTVSDGPALWRPAQPSGTREPMTVTGAKP
jgi:uncharacterized membrane protein